MPDYNGPLLPPGAIREDGSIDVAELIAAFDDAGHASRADRYFARTDFANLGLSKPWGTAEQADQYMGKLRAALQLMDLFPGAQVVDFGCGLGWISRALARMRYRVFACDVAQTALRIAEAFTIGREPDIASRITWHLLDGPRIPLPDGSIDRIICFDALHHVPAPAPVLAEMARVLCEGGIAVFVEPGDRHSSSKDSQFEMHEFGVIENDIDIAALIRIAADSSLLPGCAVLHPWRLPTMPLADFPAQVERVRARRTADATLVRDVFRCIDPSIDSLRIFSLMRPGSSRPDSRRVRPAGSDGHAPPGRIDVARIVPTPKGLAIELVVHNLGPYRWITEDTRPGVVRLGVQWRDAEGRLHRDWRRATVPAEASEPGASAQMKVVLQPPRGCRALVFDLVAEHVTWFETPIQIKFA